MDGQTHIASKQIPVWIPSAGDSLRNYCGAWSHGRLLRGGKAASRECVTSLTVLIAKEGAGSDFKDFHQAHLSIDDAQRTPGKRVGSKNYGQDKN